MPFLSQTDIPTTASGWVVAALFLVTLVVREFMPQLRERKKANMESRKQEEARLLKPYMDQVAECHKHIGRLEGLLLEADKRMDKLRDEHLDCAKNQSALLVKVELLTAEVERLRNWRHDISNETNAAQLRAELMSRKDGGGT